MAEFIRHVAGIRSGLSRTLELGMREAAFAVEAASKRQLSSGPNRAIKTGYLRASIGVASVLPYRAVVRTGAYYGVYIHEGTRYIRARPYMKAGLKDATPEIEKIFGKRVRTLVETL